MRVLETLQSLYIQMIVYNEYSDSRKIDEVYICKCYLMTNIEILLRNGRVLANVQSAYIRMLVNNK
jgi:hypothetical protein